MRSGGAGQMNELLNSVPMTGSEGDYKMWIIAGAVVLVAAAVFLFGRKKKGNSIEDDDDKDDDK